MEYSYLDFLNIGSLRPIDYEIMCDALAQFNLTYGQAMEYLTKNPSAEMECYRSLLLYGEWFQRLNRWCSM